MLRYHLPRGNDRKVAAEVLDLPGVLTGVQIRKVGRVSRYIEQKFQNQILPLDGQEYERCDFRDCVFTYSGAQHFLLDDGTMDGCRLEVHGAAANTLVALAELCKTPLADSVKRLLVGPLADLFKEQSA